MYEEVPDSCGGALVERRKPWCAVDGMPDTAAGIFSCESVCDGDDFSGSVGAFVCAVSERIEPINCDSGMETLQLKLNFV